MTDQTPTTNDARPEPNPVTRARSAILWTLAFLITAASMVHQRRSGPTYPLDFRGDLGEAAISATLPRTHPGEGDERVEVTAPDERVSGVFLWRRYRSHDDWMSNVMTRDGDALVASIPHQPPAGKVQYRLEFSDGERTLTVPKKEADPIIIRFRGEVPRAVLTIHIVLMVASMLVSTRAGLQALHRGARLRAYTIWAVGLMLAGGLVFGPIVQKYAFDAYWTGWPVGEDLTDTKTLVAAVFWLIALASVRKRPRARAWVLIAAAVTFVIFIIPHSLRGSELDYTALDQIN